MKPETLSGQMLASFLHGLLPEFTQFPKQIAEIEQQARQSLDVERLAQVLIEHFGPSYWPGHTDVTIIGSTPVAIAERIATAYANAAWEPPAQDDERMNPVRSHAFAPCQLCGAYADDPEAWETCSGPVASSLEKGR